jgi:hypothetical protein
MMNLNTIVGKYNDTESTAITGIDQYQEKNLKSFNERIKSLSLNELISEFNNFNENEKIICLSKIIDEYTDLSSPEWPELKKFLLKNQSLVVKLRDLSKKDTFGR